MKDLYQAPAVEIILMEDVILTSDEYEAELTD